MKLRRIFGQPSWRLASDKVEAFVTQLGGHLGPVTFSLPHGKIQPYSIAPWAEEPLPEGWPAVLKVLRGDFLCLPFGGNTREWHGEKHPIHGESANAVWKWQNERRENDRRTLHLSLKTRSRPGRIDKHITLIDGHTAIYCQDIISGMAGPMTVGHHAMLRFPEHAAPGVITTSKFVLGKVCDAFESPALGGYSWLKAGAEFKTLKEVPTITGEMTNLSIYPSRRGFEDLVILVADSRQAFSWTAVTLPRQGYVWFALKDPSVLRSTVLWFSNGGRHYAPWNGRHVGVLGLEEVTAYLHYGLAESIKKNPLKTRGLPTVIKLSKGKSMDIRYIMAVQAVPRAFDAVADIKLESDKAVLQARSGKQVVTRLETSFLIPDAKSNALTR